MEFEITHLFNASAQAIYKAWLNSNKHTAMTGGEAIINANIGDAFTAWDQYISGENITLIPNSKIVQYWRTVEFLQNQPDSLLELELIKLSPNKTKLVLKHSCLLPEDIKYKQGWIDNYFEPMSFYFDGLNSNKK
jgi:activator of HSP90 ATPase